MGEPVIARAPEPRAAVRRMKEYHPPVAGRDGLRLDFNENTLACSPRVIEVLRKITAADLTRYPERGTVEAIVADALGVSPDRSAADQRCRRSDPRVVPGVSGPRRCHVAASPDLQHV